MFNAIAKTATLEIYHQCREALRTPLKSTGFPPFCMVTADKATINRRTNQTILVTATLGGIRTVIPIGSPLVYHGEDGGRSDELVTQIFESFKSNLQLQDENLDMIAG